MLFKQTLEVQEARSSDDGRRPKPPVPRDCVRSSFEAAANARGAFSLGSALSWTYFRHIGGELLITSPWPCSAMTRSSKGWKPSCSRRPSRAKRVQHVCAKKRVVRAQASEARPWQGEGDVEHRSFSTITILLKAFQVSSECSSLDLACVPFRS